VLYPKLTANRSAFAEFNLSSFLYALRYYRREEFAAAFINCGLLQLLDDKEVAAAEKLLASLAGNRDLVQILDATSASAIAGTKLLQQALHFEQSGYIDTQTLAKSIIQHPNIQWQGNSRIDSIEQLTGSQISWQATGAEKTFQADALIVCAAEASKKLLAEQIINSKNIRGQISSFNSTALPQLRSVVCHRGYICPTASTESDYSCGATFDLHEQSRSLDAQSQAYNLQQLAQALPDFSALALQSHALAGRVEFRCAANDYMPVVGPVPHVDAFRRDYAVYKKSAKAHIPQLGNYQQGLFINMAYGSRAYACAPINAALIRAYLLEEPYPLDFQQIKAMNPARFLVQQLAGKHVKQ
jgi:tRNA 5-methylaminomethyl-2-thiouridine biosynthesis bifunctional protein